jgi:hypothetical protein
MGELERIRVSGAIEGEYVVLRKRPSGQLTIAPEQPGGMPKVVKLKKTCTACPSQWEGTLDDGRGIYARFRWGELSVGVGKDVKDAIESSWGDKALFQEHVGDGLDGFMDFEALRSHLYGLLDFPDELEVENERDLELDPEAVKKLFPPKQSKDSS